MKYLYGAFLIMCLPMSGPDPRVEHAQVSEGPEIPMNDELRGIPWIGGTKAGRRRGALQVPLIDVSPERTQSAPVPLDPSEDKDQRITPAWLYEALDQEFHFVWDLAALSTNNKAKGPLAYFGPDHPLSEFRDALTVKSWYDTIIEFLELTPGTPITVWDNPPYGRKDGRSIMSWLDRAQREVEDSPLTIVMLVSADISTEYWHKHIERQEHRKLKTRIKFDGAPVSAEGKLQGAKFGNVIRIFRPSHKYWSYA